MSGAVGAERFRGRFEKYGMLSEFATGAYSTFTFGCVFSNSVAAARMNDQPVSVTTLIVTFPPELPARLGLASAAAAATAATLRSTATAGRTRRARTTVRAGCGGAPDTGTSLRPKQGRVTRE